MRRKILIFSTMFSLMLSFPVMAKPIYTANSSGGYDFYDPDTGCSGHVPNAPITVGSSSSESNSTATSNGESTRTEKKDDVSTKNSSVSVTGSTTEHSSETGSNTEKTSGSKVNENTNSNNTGSGSKNGGNGNNTDSGTESGGNGNNTGSGTESGGNGNNTGSGTGKGTNTNNGNNTGAGTEANQKPSKEDFKGAINKVELGKDGKLIIYSYDEAGNIVTETSNSTGFTRYTYYTDEEGTTYNFSQKVSQSDDYIIEEEFLYYTWDMINLTNNQSKFYGSQVQVAKTTADSAKVQPDLDGTYRIIGTPWYRRDYYKEITVEEEGDCDEFGNCDTDTYTERVLVDSKIVAKSSNEYTAKVPLFCDGCPVPVICVNGGCDCATTLNAICDEANKADLIIKERVELEK